jgi:hypothetical protein
MRALHLDPAQRFASAHLLRRALEPTPVDNPTTVLPPTQSAPNPWLMGTLGVLGAALLELAALTPELSHYGQGVASRDWAVVYGVLAGAALGAALGGALVPGWMEHRVRATVAAFVGAACFNAIVGLVIIVGIGHGDSVHVSMRLLAALALPAAAAGAALMRGLRVGE